MKTLSDFHCYKGYNFIQVRFAKIVVEKINKFQFINT